MNMKMLLQIEQLIILVIILIAMILVFKTINNLIAVYSKKIDIEETNIILNTELDTSILDTLDNMINDSATKYKIFKIEFKDVPYISDDIQEEMIHYILSDVLHSISPYMKKKLYCVYDKKYIENLILEKIQILVLDYTMEINGTLK